MSCSLTYEGDLARVRLDADGLCASTVLVDTFSRTVSGTWGNADSGQAWTVVGTAGEYSVQSGVGRQNNTTVNVFRTATLNAASADVDYTSSVMTDKLAVGANSIAEFVGRWTDDQNYYAARLTFAVGGAITLDVRKRVANVQTVLDSVTLGFTHVITTLYAVRLHVVGTRIKAKAWNAAGSEPATWDVEATDASLTTGTNIGHRSVLSSGTSNNPVMFSFDNLRTNSPSYATVDRTVDGFNYTIVRGAAEVGITTGCELERTIDDYEFPVGQLVTYRVRSFADLDADAPIATTTCQITVNLDQVWLKSVGRPFLNRPLDCVSEGTEVRRRARNQIADVVGRSLPVAVTDLRLGRQVTVRTVTQTTQERQDLDYLLASGDPVFIQTPLAYPIPTMYAVIEDTAESRPVKNRSCNNDWRLYELPLVEVAAPGPDVVGTLSTWQTVVNTYATWADVLAAHPTWADLLELVGDGSEVVVP